MAHRLLAGEASLDPKRSFGDSRSYRCIELQNGLTALLISDLEADISAAALTVNVGHFHDPWEIPGLAHFLGIFCCLSLLVFFFWLRQCIRTHAVLRNGEVS